MVCAPINVVLRFNTGFTYVDHCCGVVFGFNFVELLHGGTPAVYKLTEIDFVVLSFCVVRCFDGLPIHRLRYFSGSAFFVEDVASQGCVCISLVI